MQNDAKSGGPTSVCVDQKRSSDQCSVHEAVNQVSEYANADDGDATCAPFAIVCGLLLGVCVRVEDVLDQVPAEAAQQNDAPNAGGEANQLDLENAIKVIMKIWKSLAKFSCVESKIREAGPRPFQEAG